MINIMLFRQHPELKNYFEQAYTEIMMGESEFAAISLRKCLEYIVSNYCQKYCPVQKRATVDEKIKCLEFNMHDKKIPSSVLTRDDIQLFYDVKQIGNKGAHGSGVSARKVEERYYDLEEFIPKFLEEFK